MIVRKGDGAYLYATTDLAALKYRAMELKKDWIIYITDDSQREHFRMVFEVDETPSSPTVYLLTPPLGCSTSRVV